MQNHKFMFTGVYAHDLQIIKDIAQELDSLVYSEHKGSPNTFLDARGYQVVKTLGDYEGLPTCDVYKVSIVPSNPKIRLEQLRVEKFKGDIINIIFTITEFVQQGRPSIRYIGNYNLSNSDFQRHYLLEYTYTDIYGDYSLHTVRYKDDKLAHHYKQYAGAEVPVFTSELGECTYLCMDVQYSLVYSPSTGMYASGYMRFNKQEAIAYWEKALQEDKDDYGAKVRKKRAALFLQAIHANSRR